MTNMTVKSIFPRKALWVAGVIVGLNFGCAQHSALEEDYGKSVKQMRYVQTWNKAAILDPQLEPVYGMDGHASESVLKDYHSTFSKPTEDPVKKEFNFDFGSTSGGGQ